MRITKRKTVTKNPHTNALHVSHFTFLKDENDQLCAWLKSYPKERGVEFWMLKEIPEHVPVQSVINYVYETYEFARENYSTEMDIVFYAHKLNIDLPFIVNNHKENIQQIKIT